MKTWNQFKSELENAKKCKEQPAGMSALGLGTCGDTKPNMDEAIVQPRPGGQVRDRSLEGFTTLLNQLGMEMKSVMNPQAKQELMPLVNQFRQQMTQILSKYQSQGIGFSQQFQPNPTYWGGIPK